MGVIQYRRGTAAEWAAANPILAAGEPGYETDTGLYRIGNGVNRWTQLKPATGPPGQDGEDGQDGADSTVPGPANRLTVAQTNTLAPGSPASVTVGGTSPNQTLTFGIPRGADGDITPAAVAARDAAQGYRDDARTARDASAASATTSNDAATRSSQSASQSASSAAAAQQSAQDAANAAGGGVTSVNGDAGPAVSLDAADVGARPAGDVPWAEVSGKPATYPPSAHNHDGTYATPADLSTASTADRARANHTGQQTSSTIADLREAVEDIVGALFRNGVQTTVTYDDAANTLKVDATGADAEAMRDTIGAALVGVGLVAVTVNDALDTITVSTTATQNQSDAHLLARGNHTGTQTLATISDAGTAAKANTGTAQGNVPVLGSGGKLDPAVVPSSSSGGGGVLAVAVLNPTTGATNYQTTSSTPVVVDPALTTGQVTVPASGRVLIRYSGSRSNSSTRLAVLDGSTPMPGSSYQIPGNVGFSYSYLATGLVPGSVHTFSGAYYPTAGGGTAFLTAGYNSANEFGLTTVGPITLEVLAA